MQKKHQTFCNLVTKALKDIHTEDGDLASMFRPLVQDFHCIFIDEAEDWNPVQLNKISNGALKDYSKNGILWILFDHIQSSSLNAGYGIAESGRHLIPSVNLPGTVLQRGGSPDCEHRTKEGIKVTCACIFTFKADDGKYHEWEDTTKVILPIKQCDCKNKDKSHEKLPMTILKKIYRSSVRCHDFL